MHIINKYLNLIRHDSNFLKLITEGRSDHLKDEDFSDWQVTVISYISCFYVKTAIYILTGEVLQFHHEIHHKINSIPELLAIARPYRKTEEPSRQARYDGRKFDKDYLTKRILPNFNKVRDCAVSIIKNKVPNVPIINVDFVSK
jgi:hypothetical protein